MRPAWRGRLAKVEWEAGSAARGREVFVARACQRCHEAAGHLGPELKGAVARMSRDDLFRAILDPNLDVSPTYHTTTIVTAAGQVYNGVIVYESPESTLLQTGPDTTVRLTNTEASSARKSLRLADAQRAARPALGPAVERPVRLFEDPGGPVAAC